MFFDTQGRLRSMLVSWTSLAEQKATLAGKVKAGVSALNSTSRENVVRFADLKLGK